MARFYPSHTKQYKVYNYSERLNDNHQISSLQKGTKGRTAKKINVDNFAIDHKI